MRNLKQSHNVQRFNMFTLSSPWKKTRYSCLPIYNREWKLPCFEMFRNLSCSELLLTCKSLIFLSNYRSPVKVTKSNKCVRSLEYYMISRDVWCAILHWIVDAYTSIFLKIRDSLLQFLDQMRSIVCDCTTLYRMRKSPTVCST